MSVIFWTEHQKSGERLRVTVQLLDVAQNSTVWATSIDETISDFFSLEDTLSTKVIEALLPQLTGGELEEFQKRGTESAEAFEHYLRGRYYFNSGTEEGFAKAFVSFHSAIAADPNYAHAYAGIANYYSWLGIYGVLPPQECFQPAIKRGGKSRRTRRRFGGSARDARFCRSRRKLRSIESRFSSDSCAGTQSELRRCFRVVCHCPFYRRTFSGRFDVSDSRRRTRSAHAV